VLRVDRGRGTGQGAELLEKQFGMHNAVLQPIISMRQEVAVLLSANRKQDFSFREDSLDLLKVFGQQVAIALENDLLARRAEQLKVIDELTGLYNAGYMKSRLEEEVSRAVRYHRPCSLILLGVDEFQKLQDLYGSLAGESVLHQLADLLKGQVSEVDRIGRMGPDEFALILPERNKREAIEMAESIRRAVESHKFSNGPQPLPCSLTVSAGISENPLDGSTGETLFAKASEAIGRAKKQGRNKVESC
jgi:diguanylate cyclase (GGDEF)-like protein